MDWIHPWIGLDWINWDDSHLYNRLNVHHV